MSELLRRYIRTILTEMVLDSPELSELQMGIIRDELRKARVLKSLRLDVDEFSGLQDNFDDWKKIFSQGSIKYLGSGRQGSAFSLGTDKVLKLEPGASRAAEIEDALYSGSDVGGGLPSVLSTGIFKSNIGNIGWSISEKVQDADKIGEDPDWKVLWRSISEGITKIVSEEQKSIKDYEKKLKKQGISPQEITVMSTYAAEQGLSGAVPTKFADRNSADIAARLLQMLPKDTMSAVEERYRLSPDWFTKFIKGIQNHYKLGMVDFKPDNMGVRRVRGGEGEIIFFDAASAKRRDIKKWEPS
jgi:hypothetical protein